MDRREHQARLRVVCSAQWLGGAGADRGDLLLEERWSAKKPLPADERCGPVGLAPFGVDSDLTHVIRMQ
jgi:hypothetical protein